VKLPFVESSILIRDEATELQLSTTTAKTRAKKDNFGSMGIDTDTQSKRGEEEPGNLFTLEGKGKRSCYPYETCKSCV
jgi:hypothetical protein